MVLFNYSTKELTAKIVYYGPGLCGKTTNLEFIYESLPEDKRGRMLSLSTQTDRTLYFDFLPVELGDIRGMTTRVQLYTVPGQVFYDETRRMVLKGVDGVVFVADSQAAMAEANLESFKNLQDNLQIHGLELSDVSMVLQFNKRDLPDIKTVEEMNAALNRFNAPFYEAIATTGIGVHDTLKAISKLVLRSLTSRYENSSEPLQAPVNQDTTDSVSVTPSIDAADHEATASVEESSAASIQTGDADWECADLENELDQMDATEIQGLLEEVDGFDASPEGGLETPESAPFPEGETSQETPPAAAWQDDTSTPTESEDLFATPATGDADSGQDPGDGSFWMGAPDGEQIPAEPTSLEDALAVDQDAVLAADQEPVLAADQDAVLAGDQEAGSDPYEAQPVETPAPTFQEIPEPPASDLPPELTAERPLTFESFLEQAPEEEPAATMAGRVNLDPTEVTPAGDAIAEMAVPVMEATDHPALVPGQPEQDGNGDLRVPLRLQLNGDEHTFILTLSVQPQRETPS
jgi:signal recognition particle receptor subunit beta